MAGEGAGAPHEQGTGMLRIRIGLLALLVIGSVLAIIGYFTDDPADRHWWQPVWAVATTVLLVGVQWKPLLREWRERRAGRVDP